MAGTGAAGRVGLAGASAGAVLVLDATGLSAGFTTLSTVTDEQLLAVAETGAPGQPAGSTALSVPLATAAGLRWLR